MQILALSPRIPAPGLKGFQVQAFHRLAHLARQHRVDLVCFGDPARDGGAAERLQSLGVSVTLVPWSPVIGLGQALRAIPQRHVPFQCALYASGRFRRAIRRAAQQRRYDLVYANTIRVLTNVPHDGIPVVVDLVDSMALNFRRRAQEAGRFARPLLEAERTRVASFERETVARSAAAFVVSQIDKAEIGSDRIHAIPLGVDLDEFRPATPIDDPVVIFTGNLSYRPNIEAITWFVDECWPRVRTAEPRARLMIAGRNPPPSLANRASRDASITLRSHVPSMAQAIRGARVAIAPMRSGSGMQFKILEAMACAVPVVATRMGCGDIQAHDGRDILLADDPADFARSVQALLADATLRDRVGGSGRRLVEAHHGWEAVSERFSEVALGAAAAARSAGSPAA